MKERIGLIDIGSNSIRLVVFQVEDNLAMREIQNIKIPARIFQYINDNHEMSQEGIDTIARIIGEETNSIDPKELKHISTEGKIALVCCET